MKVEYLNFLNGFPEIIIKNIPNGLCSACEKIVKDINTFKNSLALAPMPRTISAFRLNESNAIELVQPFDLNQFADITNDIVMTLTNELANGNIGQKIVGTFDFFSNASNLNDWGRIKGECPTYLLVSLSPQDLLSIRLANLDRLKIGTTSEIIITQCEDFN